MQIWQLFIVIRHPVTISVTVFSNPSELTYDIFIFMDGWMDGWMGGWVGGWVDGWMVGCKSHFKDYLKPSKNLEYLILAKLI